MKADDSDGNGIAVHVPPEPPMLTSTVSRILLGILIELTDVEILDQPPEGAASDC